jgi:hypothetical protein
MTDWLTARTAIAGILADVTITTPIKASVRRVYESQHANPVDFPCFQIYDVPRRTVRPPGGSREKLYDIRLRFMVNDADLDRADAIIDAFEEAAITAFDTRITLGLGGGYSVVEGPNWEEKATFDDTTKRGVMGLLVVKLKDPINAQA